MTHIYRGDGKRVRVSVPTDADDRRAMGAKSKALRERVTGGKTQKKYENEANPEMHAVKNSMRRKGFSDAKIFSGALRQGEAYRKAHPEHK